MFFLALALQASNEELIQHGQQEMRAKNFPKAAKLFSQVVASGTAPVTAYYYRANCMEQLDNHTSAISDYIFVMDHTNRSKNIYDRSSKRLYEICVQRCSLNCARDYAAKYFPSQQQYYAVKRLSDQRSHYLNDDVPFDELVEFTQQCSRDQYLWLKVLDLAIQTQNFDMCTRALQQMGRIYRVDDFNVLAQTFDLLHDLRSENFEQAVRKAKKLIGKYSDELVFSQIIKLSEQVNKGFKAFEKITPNSNKTTLQGLSSVQGDLQNLDLISVKITQIINQKLKTVQTNTMKIPSGKTVQVAQNCVKNIIETQAGLLRCAADYFLNAKPCEMLDISGNGNNQTSLTATYLQALVLSISVGNQVKQLSKEYSRDTNRDLTDQANQLEMKISKIYNMLKNIAQTASNVTQQFPNIEKFVDDVGLISDRVFALQMKLLMPNFYRILNVSRNSDAGEIKKKYFKLAKELHPDMIPKDLPEEEKTQRAKQFQRVAEAYDVLSDEDKRREYDRGNYNADARNQKQARHQQEKEQAKTSVMGRGQQYMNRGIPLQFQHGGGNEFFFDPFMFFNQFQQGGQGQRQQQGPRHIRINFNGQDIFI